MKRGRMTKEEIKFILDNSSRYTVASLSEQLDRSVESVQKILNENTSNVNKMDSPNTKTVRQDLFERALGKTNNAVVMTPAASQLTDTKMKKGRYDSECIHKIK